MACICAGFSLTVSAAEPEFIVEPGGFASQVWSLDVHPGGDLVAAAGEREVRIFSLDQGEEVAVLRGQLSRSGEGSVHTARFSPDGQFLAVGVTARDRRSVRVYETGQWDEIAGVLPAAAEVTWSLEFSPDGKHLMTWDPQGMLRLWKWGGPEGSTLVKSLRYADRTGAVMQVFDTPHPELLMCYSTLVDKEAPRFFRIFDLAEIPFASAARVPEIKNWMTAYVTMQRQTSNFFASRCDLLSDRFLVVRGEKGSAFVTYCAGGKEVRSYKQHAADPLSLAVTPDGERVVSADRVGEIHVWSVEDGRPEHLFRPETVPILDVAFAPTDDDPSRIVIEQSIAGEVVRRGFSFLGRTLKVTDFNPSPVGTRHLTLPFSAAPPERPSTIVSAFRHGGIGDERTGGYEFDPGNFVQVSVVGKRNTLGCRVPVLTGAIGALHAWDALSENPLPARQFSGHGQQIASIDVSKDGTRMVSCDTSGIVCFWSLEDGPEFGNAPQTGHVPFREVDGIVKTVIGTDLVRAGDRVVNIDGKPRLKYIEDLLYRRAEYAVGQPVELTLERDGRTLNVTVPMVPGPRLVEPLLMLLVTESAEWVLWTPRGYYECSPGADRFIGWVRSQGSDRAAEFFPAQLFREERNRPDLLKAIWETGSVEAALEKVNDGKPVNPVPDEEDFVSVSVISPEFGKQFLRERRVSIEAIARPGLERVTAFAVGDGREFSGTYDPTTGAIAIPDVALHGGRNRLRVYVELKTDAGRVLSKPGELEVESLAAQAPKNLHVLAVGVSKYARDANKNIALLSDSATQFAAHAKRQAFRGLYGEVRTKVLLDAEATRANVLSALRDLQRTSGENDCVMLFFAAHGDVEGDAYCLCTHDTDFGNMRATALRQDELLTELEALRPRQTILFLDTCRSGTLGGGGNPFNEFMADDSGPLFYAACGPGEEGQTHPASGLTLFTYALLRTAADPPLNRRKTATIEGTELESGIADYIREEGQPQTPLANASRKSRDVSVFRKTDN